MVVQESAPCWRPCCRWRCGPSQRGHRQPSRGPSSLGPWSWVWFQGLPMGSGGLESWGKQLPWRPGALEPWSPGALEPWSPGKGRLTSNLVVTTRSVFNQVFGADSRRARGNSRQVLCGIIVLAVCIPPCWRQSWSTRDACRSQFVYQNRTLCSVWRDWHALSI